MNFKRDLLLVDLETTGTDPNRHEIIQLAAVLLDKKTLKEKKFFNAYIKPVRWINRDLASMQVNGIKYDWLKTAPNLAMVLKNFQKRFNLQKVVLSYYVGVFDIVFLQKAFVKTNRKWPFDYHYFNIWAAFYPLLAKRNKLNSNKDFAGFGVDYLIKYFKIRQLGPQHDALVDCRLEAEILRKVMKELK